MKRKSNEKRKSNGNRKSNEKKKSNGKRKSNEKRGEGQHRAASITVATISLLDNLINNIYFRFYYCSF